MADKMEDQFDKSYIARLAHKWRSGTLSEQERLELERWDRSHDDHILILPEDTDPNEILNRLLTRVQNEMDSEQVVTAKIKLWPRYAGIAAAVTAMAVGVYFFNPFKHTGSEDQQTVQTLKNDVAPGRQGATLTLANGKQIRLGDAKDGELAKQAGVTVSKTADGQLVYTVAENTTNNTNEINTLSTTKGETYQVRLPDGTSVWLNAASSLTYSANLVERGKRRVRLDGEGYFEVAKDKARPFVVITKDQEVEVLGTQFNINSYPDESSIKTTLVEGSVRITAGSNKKVIKPGEQALNSGSTIQVAEVNLENVTDWKDGDFYLNHVDFKTAMRKIARWYNVEVIYDKSVPDDLEAGGWISRDQKLSAVLQFIESSGIVHFKVEGRKIYVTK